jgi:hypothetical protein
MSAGLPRALRLKAHLLIQPNALAVRDYSIADSTASSDRVAKVVA